MISRDWICLNERCATIFHSFEKANPPCPQCGCVRVNWIPGGGHIGKVAPRADATLKGLARDFGMSDMNSPSHSRLNRTMPKLEQPPTDPGLGTIHFGPGFSSQVSRYGATCDVSNAPLDLRGKVSVGSVMQGRDGGLYNTGAPRERSASVPDAKRNAEITYLRKRK